MRRRAGFTLVETLIAVIIVSALVLMAFPRVNSAMVKSNLRSGRTRVVNMFAMARAAATQGGRTAAYVRFNGNTAVITATPRRTAGGAGTEDTLGSVVNLNTVYGATISGGVPEVSYDPRGIAKGFIASSGTVFKLTHGSYSDSIKVDMLGRVTK